MGSFRLSRRNPAKLRTRPRGHKIDDARIVVIVLSSTLGRTWLSALRDIVFLDSNLLACEGYMDEDLIIAAIDDEIGRLQQVRALLSGVNAGTAVTAEAAAPTQEAVRRRRVSPAARRRMAEAQKKRWAAVKGEAVMAKPTEKTAHEAPAENAAAKKSPQRRRVSPAARRRMAEAQKKRWAAAKLAKSTPAKKAAKKAPAKKAPAKAVTAAVRKTLVRKAVAKSTKKTTAAKKTAAVPNTAALSKATEAAPF